MPRLAAASLSLALLGSLTAACDAATPQVGKRALVLPSLQAHRGQQALTSPSTDDTRSASSALTAEETAAPTECAGWETAREDYDEATGHFEYVYTCAEGGDVAESRTVGDDDGAGNGAYTQTSVLRDGSEVVWSFEYTTAADGLSQSYTGSSTQGESYAGTYTFLDEGHSQVDETWTMAEGVYVVDGVYGQDGSFNGGSTFDDPATAASPDWSYSNTTLDDGSVTQTSSSAGEGYTSSSTALYGLDGSVAYDFITDDTSTAVAPDYSGAYTYAADGSGSGGYTQELDDGSRLVVSDVIHADQRVTESWTFDDAATALAVDQEGTLTYGLDGSAEGTVTRHLEGGAAETCDLHLAADGSWTTDNCH